MTGHNSATKKVKANIAIMLRMASETPAQKINSKYTTTDTNEPSEIKLQQFKQTQIMEKSRQQFVHLHTAD